MKKIKILSTQLLEISIFLGMIAVFVYSGYKIAGHYGLIRENSVVEKAIASESCSECHSCLSDDWRGDLCRRIRDWCQQHSCGCQPTPETPPPTPTSCHSPSPTPGQEVSPTPTLGTIPTPTNAQGEITPTRTVPTPTTAGQSQDTGRGGSSDGGGGGGSASPCSPPEAPKTPELVSAVIASSTEVKLTWKKADRATHYAIAYGESSRNYTYGNANVGDTDSYTVGGLKTGKTYYFAVSAAIGGDCPVASPYSNELPSHYSSGSLILGARINTDPKDPTPTGNIEDGISTQAGEVEGTKSGNSCPFWWIVLLGQTLLLGGYYAAIFRREQPPRRWWLIAPTLVILAYLIDRYAHTHWFEQSRYCPWEKWLGIALASFETIGYRFLRKTA